MGIPIGIIAAIHARGRGRVPSTDSRSRFSRFLGILDSKREVREADVAGAVEPPAEKWETDAEPPERLPDNPVVDDPPPKAKPRAAKRKGRSK